MSRWVWWPSPWLMWWGRTWHKENDAESHRLCLPFLLQREEEVASALAADAKGALMVRVDDKYAEKADSSDDEEKLDNNNKKIDIVGANGGARENLGAVVTCWSSRKTSFPQVRWQYRGRAFVYKAKMKFLAAHATKPARQ